MAILFAIVLLAAVGAFVSYPFWGKSEVVVAEDPLVAGLEAARDSKYREIRDADADRASGKLSQEDFNQVNAELRREAVQILRQLDEAGGGASQAEAEADDTPQVQAGDRLEAGDPPRADDS